MYIKAPAGEDYIAQCEAQEAEATVSPLLGYMFDDTDFQTEASVISSVISEYTPTLQNGLCGSEEETLAYLDEFVNALDAAGMNDAIAANQEQQVEQHKYATAILARYGWEAPHIANADGAACADHQKANA